MSCGCGNEFDVDNPNGNAGCGPCNPCEDSTPTCESLPSALTNFTAHFFGTVTKTLVNGKVQWALPCNLATGLPDNPRLENEGLACYFLRLFQDGIVGLTGEKGDQGDPGEDGLNGYSFVSSAFVIPTAECPVVQFSVEDPEVILVGAYVFVDGAGWFSVVSRTGSLLMCQLIQAVNPAGTAIPVGAFVAVTGPEGPQGVQGPKGDKGAQGFKGDTGSPGVAGADGASAKTETQSAYNQPAVGSTVVISVVDSSYFTGGQQIYVIGGGYYTVVAVAAGSVTGRNLGIAATNVVPTTPVPAGSAVFVSGAAPIVSADDGVASGTSDVEIDTTPGEVTFDTTTLETLLPGPGTYEVRLGMTYASPGASAANTVTAQLYNNTTAALTGRVLVTLFAAHNSVSATSELTQRITVAGATTLRVHAYTDTGTVEAVSTECALAWTLVNPIA